MSSLSGVRVLDLSRVFSGPWAAQMLADFGADVIKVERPGRGDDVRQQGLRVKDAQGRETKETSSFIAVNRGKRSVTVDMSQPAGQALIRRLAEKCDILIENFKAGDLARYGLDYASLKTINPRLVYCSITGFGQTGPVQPPAWLRPDLPVDERADERHRPCRRRAGRRAAARRLFGERHHGRLLRRRRHPGRLAPSRRRLGRGPAHRPRVARCAGRIDFACRDDVPGVGPAAAAAGQRFAHHLPVAIVRMRGRPDRDRRGQRLTVRRALPRTGPARARERRALRDESAACEEPARADPDAGRNPEDAHGARVVCGLRRCRCAERPDQRLRGGVRRSADRSSRDAAAAAACIGRQRAAGGEPGEVLRDARAIPACAAGGRASTRPKCCAKCCRSPIPRSTDCKRPR